MGVQDFCRLGSRSINSTEPQSKSTRLIFLVVEAESCGASIAERSHEPADHGVISPVCAGSFYLDRVAHGDALSAKSTDLGG
jgi:hypothetical protein